jgi:hypothetical protein
MKNPACEAEEARGGGEQEQIAMSIRRSTPDFFMFNLSVADSKHYEMF